MAEASERFRREMDGLRDKNESTQSSHNVVRCIAAQIPVTFQLTTYDFEQEASLDDLDLLDKKLEAVASGQFDDYKEESLELDAQSTNVAPENITSDSTLFEPENVLLKHDLSTGIPLNFMSGTFNVSEPQALEAADEWFYLDPQGQQQGPFKTSEMREWFDAGYFKPHLPIRSSQESRFTPLANHFATSVVPFASVPKLKIVETQVDFERQHLIALKQQHLAQIQQQQQEQRLLQLRRNNEIRDNPQILDAPLQHQSHILQQQQQQMLLHQHVQEQAPISSALQWPHHPQKVNDSIQYLFQSSFDSGKLISHDNENLKQQTEAPYRPIVGLVTQPGMIADLSKSSNTPIESSFSLHEDEKKPINHAWGANNAQSTLANKSNESAQPVRRLENAETQSLHHQVPGSHIIQEKPLRVTSEQAQQSKTTEKGISSAWVHNNVVERSHVKSLKEIQDEEQRAIKEQNRREQSSMNLEQMGAQLKMMLGIESTNLSAATTSPKSQNYNVSAVGPWNTASTVTAQVSSKQSLRDILAEEERLAQKRVQQHEVAVKSAHWSNVVAGKPSTIASKSSRSLGPVPAAVLKSSSQARMSNTNSRGQAAHTSTSRPTVDESGDASFWNFDAAQSVVPDSNSNTVSTNKFGSKVLVPELMTWCAKELEQIGGVENLTLMEYCATLDDPGEIRQYLAAYLGSTPRVSAFATGFIQKKKESQNLKYKKAQEDVPSEVAKSTNTSNMIGKKGRRRSKGQRVDPSLLSYSVGSV